jgi:hypothetical protein
VEEEEENLSSQHLMSDLLVDQMCDESGTAVAYALVVALESLAELSDESVDKKLANFGQLGVHNSHHGRVDWRKRQTSSLRLHDTPAEQASTADQVLVEQLRHNVLDI